MTEATMESPKTLGLVFIGLLTLLLITWAISFVDLGVWSLVVSLVIAIAKATLVLLFFMELRHERGIIHVFAGAGLFWLLILIALTMTDFMTRGYFR